MSRFKTFSIFLVLVIVWALFFATVKFFLWGDLASTIEPDLQQIAGYLSLWGIGAFLVGGAFAQTFLKKYYLFVIGLLTFFLTVYGFVFSYQKEIVFAIVVTSIGFLYWLWNVMKSVIISIEIKKTWLPETAVTAIVGMMFVLCIIAWSLIGSVIYERLWHDGYYIILSYLVIASAVPFFLDYDGVSFSSAISKGWRSYFLSREQGFKTAMRQYIPDLKYITKKYGAIIVTSSILWSLSTIISQSTVEYSALKFGIKNSEATMILLYSALGAIIGSFLSIRMSSNRWFYFLIFNLLFALTVFLIPILWSTFTILSIMAVVLGTCFGTAVNLSDSYLLRCYGEENKKEYGASTMGLIFSIILFISMFISSIALKNLWYEVVMYIFSGIILVVSSLLYYSQRHR